MSAARSSVAQLRALILPPVRVSARGVRFIASWEGFVGHAYNDAVGNATVGYGHLLHLGPVTGADRARWASVSQASALQLLAADLAAVEHALVDEIAPRLRSQARFDAIASAVFNLGPGVLSTRSTLGRCLHTVSRAGVADALLLYDRAGGRELAGLLARRRAERELWLRGDYGGRA